MYYEELPHEVTFQKLVEVPDGGGGRTIEWFDYLTVPAFLDTPTSNEKYQAHKLNNPLDRYLYTYYRTDITPDMCVVYEDEMQKETYELAGRPEDQGGQHEIMRIPLKLVPNE